MQPDRKTKTIREACLAYRTGVCASSPCFECSAVHQALRIASVTLARWPRPLPKSPR